jgi:hypothetical protein
VPDPREAEVGAAKARIRELEREVEKLKHYEKVFEEALAAAEA